MLSYRSRRSRRPGCCTTLTPNSRTTIFQTFKIGKVRVYIIRGLRLRFSCVNNGACSQETRPWTACLGVNAVQMRNSSDLNLERRCHRPHLSLPPPSRELPPPGNRTCPPPSLTHRTFPLLAFILPLPCVNAPSIPQP